MKKIYLKPETTVVEYKLEGMIAQSGSDLRFNDDERADDDCVVYSNKQGWNSSLWSE
uniref:hypothetical protein n=1 Tax=Alloprevotella sp. TaxID=1872471 RepID=UPI003FED8453